MATLAPPEDHLCRLQIFGADSGNASRTLSCMAVRTIPKNHLVVTGRHVTARGSTDFESILEKEYMLLLDFDPRVVRYDAQPLRIALSRGRSYVPDLLVSYDVGKSDSPIGCDLVEIKCMEHLEKYADDYREKFEAATAYAAHRGWQFVIRTERDIRTPRLRAVKFLRRYRDLVPDLEREARLLASVECAGSRCPVNVLMAKVSDSAEDRANFAAPLWRLVATRQLRIDLDATIKADSIVWL